MSTATASRFLSGVRKGRKRRPRRLMVYGIGGTGKSTFGAACPAPVFLDLEDGIGDIDTSAIVNLSTLTDVMDAINELTAGGHEFKTLVVDSLDVLEAMIWDHVAVESGVGSIEDIGYGKGYIHAVERWREVLAALERCQAAGMMVVLIGHAQVVTFNDPAHESYSRYSPRLHKQALGVIFDWCDECLFATFRVFTKQQAEKFDKKFHRGISDGSRVFKCEERPSHVAKNRLGMPEEIELSWNAYRALAYPQQSEVKE